MLGNLHVHGLSDPIFIVFFTMDFLPGLSFGCLTNPSPLLCGYHGHCVPGELIFTLSSSKYIWLVILKLCSLVVEIHSNVEAFIYNLLM